ncbi:uncharacterized protein LOC106066413 isoform X1 [Biomphalaria glabrata]|uniref:Uncharacterized protein LOC106066413 isoform X1 n=1 Tax=Biomphalaria glabrata TaxID=6526 RepID=A0A9W2YNI7_BIOGL|nr:uncharacterized protein LOC106066413 isoform X1 [Biomphalaria glabrata]
MRHRYSCIKACQNRFNASDLVLCEADNSTISDSTKSNCSNDEPRLCDSGHEFYHNGTCQACFPANIPETDLLTWCRDIGQHDSSQMRHSLCTKACQNRFKASDLVLCEETWKNVAISVIVLASVEGLLLLVCGAVWIVKRYCALKGKKTQYSNPTQDGKVPINLASQSQLGKKGSQVKSQSMKLTEHQDAQSTHSDSDVDVND